MDEYQKKANSLFEDGEYDEAISTMALSASISAEDYKKFVAQCNSFMTEQYKVLIEQSIQDDDYNELVALHEAYRKRFGENKEIEGLVSDGLKRVKVPSLHGCPFCGEMISDDAKTCPYCGENVEEFFSALYKEKEAKAAKDIQSAEKILKQKRTTINHKNIVVALKVCLCIGVIVILAYFVVAAFTPKTIEDVDTEIANGEPEKAVGYLKEMAEKGDTTACLRLIDYSKNNKFGLKNDPAIITKWELIAIGHGCKTVMLDLCIRYANGDGIEQDVQKAISLLESYTDNNPRRLLDKVNSIFNKKLNYVVHEKLSNQNFRDAYYYLARDLYFGYGIEQDKDKAEYWITKYLSEGNEDIETLENMVCFYEDVERKPFLYWAEKASNAGSFIAMYKIALYYEGEGQYENAFKWYKKSADLGYIYAIGHLGLCYLYGKGVKKNADKASKLIVQAREYGVHWDHYTWERKSRYKD